MVCSTLVIFTLLFSALGVTPVSAAGSVIVLNANESGAGSLRNALVDVPSGGTITFAPGLSGGTITLASTLTIAKNLTIDGSALSKPITLSGNNAVRVIYINTGVTAALKGLVITKGKATDIFPDFSEGEGAGIYNDYGSTLTVDNCTISNNWARTGGGILNNGTLTVTNSTFTGNTAIDWGGGLDNFGTLTLTNSTFSANSAQGGGGGLANSSSLTMNNNTLSGNTVGSSGRGSGIYTNATLIINNTILADSTSGGECYNWMGLASIAGGHNLVKDDSGGFNCGTKGSGATDQYQTGDPLLGALADNGGPTFTLALLPGSPAIDAGNAAVCSAAPVSSLDQRGVARPAACDIGAFESRGFTLAKTGGDNQSTAVSTAFSSPLALNVTSAFSEPVDGGEVTFTGPASGASTNPAKNTALITAGAVSKNVTANATAGGPYDVTTSAAGAALPVIFSLSQALPYSTVTLTFHNAAHTPVTSGAIGDDLHVQAAVTANGAVPTGSLAFTQYDNISCAGSGHPAGTLPIAAVVHPSLSAALSHNGLSFKAHYGGDSVYSPVDSACASISTSPYPSVLPLSAGSHPEDGAVLTSLPATLVVQFTSDVFHGDPANGHSADNPANYLLVSPGANHLFDTAACGPSGVGGLKPDDVQVAITSVSYDPAAYAATLQINKTAALPNGPYRLFICGTTSITDAAGTTFLNNHLSDSIINFTLAVPSAAADPSGGGSGSSSTPATLPPTGFAPGQLTPLAPQTVSYAELGDLWMEIPVLNIQTAVVGVPQSASGAAWDVSWLGHRAGWLNGSAFPSHNGNSVLTGHVWNADDTPGLLVNLKQLAYGDAVKLHAFGQVYSYAVRDTRLVLPSAVYAALKHEDQAWVTLVTCEDFIPGSTQYAHRRIVRAVLVSVAPEK